MTKQTKLRCAIYTRKSSEEGLEQDFNSLDAQREACEAYILSQKHEGWAVVKTCYDDGGFSGGNMERPALKALLSAIENKQIDIVIVYKVDRLTRALTDFAKIVERFDTHNVSFVSVTQQFNTTTSMGRLTLNVLLSFAQFEREVTGERIRDKIAASKKKGLWMGGWVPFGYRPNERTLVIEESEAKIVREIFALYLENGSVLDVVETLERRKIMVPPRTTRRGRVYGCMSFGRGRIYKVLSNPVYCGEIRHKDTRHPGQHPAIISAETFEAVASKLASNVYDRRHGKNAQNPSLLAGLLRDTDGNKLVSTHANKQGKRFRYYISKAVHDGRQRGRVGRDRITSLESNHEDVWRLPAAQIEPIIVDEISTTLRDHIKLHELIERVHPETKWSIPQRATIESRAKHLADKISGHDLLIARATIIDLVSQIDLAPNQLSIVFNKSNLLRALDIDCDSQDENHHDPFCLIKTISLRRRGIETKLILTHDGKPVAEPDMPLVRAIAKSRRWVQELANHVYPSVKELAKAYRVDERYVAKHIPLAWLSPTIVETILNGHQPVELTTWDMLNRIKVPISWTAQEQRLGFK